MKEINEKIQYKGKEYLIVFNFNVMQEIQEEYGSVDKWGELSDGASGEPNAKAIIFGYRCMLNEGIDIQNEENGTDEKPLTHKQVGRIIFDMGFEEATKKLNDTIIESTQSTEKNA